MRLDRYISKALGVTRKEAKEIIRRGEVSVDGKVVRQPDFKVPEGASVSVEGTRVEAKDKVYIMLNKPKGYLSTTEREADYPSFLELLPEYEHLKPFAAGRLDVDSEGLLLVTTDGVLAHRITHPKWKLPKTYEVELERPLSEEDIQKITRGVEIDGKPVEVVRIEPDPRNKNRVFITLTEGRYRIVKRLFKSLGNRVVNLRRISIGPIKLDETLAEGEYRELTPEEIEELKKALKLSD